MAIQINEQTNKCSNLLAYWEGLTVNTEPIYNEISKEWIFKYHNGNTCNQNPSQLTVYWQCNENADYYKVINASEIDSCEYQITIQSKYAC
eukprot:405863_1